MLIKYMKRSTFESQAPQAQCEHGRQKYKDLYDSLTQTGGTWEFSRQPWDFIITVDNHEIEKWLKSRWIWKITKQEGSYPRWQ